MNGKQLADLVQQRGEILNQLIRMGQEQLTVIGKGHMSDLMRLLSRKQQPLNQLVELGEKLRAAKSDDPQTRVWESDSMRERCRKQQDECEKMNLEVLAIEAECEAKLSHNREELRQRLERVDSGWQAVSGYADHSIQVNSGGTLDLSSD